MHVKEVEKRRTRKEIENSGYNLSGFAHFKGEILSELKTIKHRDLEDMVHSKQLTYDQIVDVLVVKYIAGSTKGYTIPPSICNIKEINLIFKSLFPKEVKLNFTFDDIRLKSNLTTKKQSGLLKKFFSM